MKLIEENRNEATITGTLDYAPPEILEKKTYKESDQFSLAVCYCKLRTGYLPYKGNIEGAMDKFNKVPPDLPDTLADAEKVVLFKALAHDPDKRFGSCCEFIYALELA